MEALLLGLDWRWMDVLYRWLIWLKRIRSIENWEGREKEKLDNQKIKMKNEKKKTLSHTTDMNYIQDSPTTALHSTFRFLTRPSFLFLILSTRLLLKYFLAAHPLSRTLLRMGFINCWIIMSA